MKVIEQIKLIVNTATYTVSKVWSILRRLRLGLVVAAVGNAAVAAIIILWVLPELSQGAQVSQQETAGLMHSPRPVARPDGFATRVAILHALKQAHAEE